MKLLDLEKRDLLPRQFLCPEITDENKRLFEIENLYSNQTLRRSFSVEVRRCDPAFNPNCKPLEDVKTFFKAFFFNMFVIVGQSNFSGLTKTVTMDMQFHS